MAELLQAGDPYLCRYNSGLPRHTPVDGSARASPRGPDTFVPIAKWELSASRVVEVTFLNSVELPKSTRWGDGPSGPWHFLC